jgi:hypothetical protein
MPPADIAYGRRMATAVRGLWNSRAVRLLSREPGVTFADIVDAWVGWTDSAGVDGDAVIGEHLGAFVAGQCARRGIAPDLYLGITHLELS